MFKQLQLKRTHKNMAKPRGGLRVGLNVGLDKHHFLKISPLMHVQMSSSAHTRAHTHTWHRSGLEIRLTGGNCGLTVNAILPV